MNARPDRYRRWALLTALIGIALSPLDLAAQVQLGPPTDSDLKAIADLVQGKNIAIFAVPRPPLKTTFLLKERQGHAMPSRTQTARAGGGNTDVAQPRDDTLIITMSGVVTAGPQPCKANTAVMDFDLNQEFEIGFADPKLKRAKLTIETQVIGLLRGDKNGGNASVSNGTASITSAGNCILSLSIDGHAVTGDDNLAINDHKGPVAIALPPGDYHLRQTFRIDASHVRSIRGKAAAAEFGPDPALDPTWISMTDPFHGANKKEFGFRVLLHVEPE